MGVGRGGGRWTWRLSQGHLLLTDYMTPIEFRENVSPSQHEQSGAKHGIWKWLAGQLDAKDQGLLPACAALA